MHGVRGPVHLTHAADPEQGKQAVLAQHRARRQLARCVEAELFQAVPERGPRQELWQQAAKSQERLDLGPQRGRTRTRLRQVASLLLDGQRTGLGEEVGHAGGFFRGQRQVGGFHRR